MDGSGNLYGTTFGGGSDPNGDGTVFKIAAGSNTITTIASASFDGGNGAPYGLIMDGSGNLYATTTTAAPTATAGCSNSLPWQVRPQSWLLSSRRSMCRPAARSPRR